MSCGVRKGVQYLCPGDAKSSAGMCVISIISVPWLYKKAALIISIFATGKGRGGAKVYLLCGELAASMLDGDCPFL